MINKTQIVSLLKKSIFKLWRHLCRVFTYICSLLMEKDGRVHQNISIKIPCGCPMVTSLIFGKSFHFPFPYFVLHWKKFHSCYNYLSSDRWFLVLLFPNVLRSTVGIIKDIWLELHLTGNISDSAYQYNMELLRTYSQSRKIFWLDSLENDVTTNSKMLGNNVIKTIRTQKNFTDYGHRPWKV